MAEFIYQMQGVDVILRPVAPSSSPLTSASSRRQDRRHRPQRRRKVYGLEDHGGFSEPTNGRTWVKPGPAWATCPRSRSLTRA